MGPKISLHELTTASNAQLIHLLLIIITAFSLPFLAKKPLDLPPIVSIELIQITDKTSIPYAPKAKKIIEKVKEEEKKLMTCKKIRNRKNIYIQSIFSI